MMFERFTTSAREVVRSALQERDRLRHQVVGTEHLLLALLDEEISSVAPVLREAGIDAARVRAELDRRAPGPTDLDERDAAALRAIGIDLAAVRAAIEASFGPGALEPPPSPTRRRLFGRWAPISPFSPRAKKVLELALREAVRLRHQGIDSEHLLLGLLRERQGRAALILTEAGVDLDELRRRTIASLRQAA